MCRSNVRAVESSSVWNKSRWYSLAGHICLPVCFRLDTKRYCLIALNLKQAPCKPQNSVDFFFKWPNFKTSDACPRSPGGTYSSFVSHDRFVIWLRSKASALWILRSPLFLLAHSFKTCVLLVELVVLYIDKTNAGAQKDVLPPRTYCVLHKLTKPRKMSFVILAECMLVGEKKSRSLSWYPIWMTRGRN